jgi:hypothetical protein
MLPAIFGLLGVIVGGFLTAALDAYWRRRHWLLQQTVKAYSEMLEAGYREIAILGSMEGDLLIGPSNRKTQLQQASALLGPRVDSRFLQLSHLCWFWERDSEIKKTIDKIRHDYGRYRTHLQVCIGERRVNLQYAGPKFEELSDSLDKLRESVAERYLRRHCFLHKIINYIKNRSGFAAKNLRDRIWHPKP